MDSLDICACVLSLILTRLSLSPFILEALTLNSCWSVRYYWTETRVASPPVGAEEPPLSQVSQSHWGSSHPQLTFPSIPRHFCKTGSVVSSTMAPGSCIMSRMLGRHSGFGTKLYSMKPENTREFWRGKKEGLQVWNSNKYFSSKYFSVFFKKLSFGI